MITVKRAQNRIKAGANGTIIGDQIIILCEGFGEISEGGLQFVGIGMATLVLTGECGINLYADYRRVR